VSCALAESVAKQIMTNPAKENITAKIRALFLKMFLMNCDAFKIASEKIFQHSRLTDKEVMNSSLG
jgi:hypothetical protein